MKLWFYTSILYNFIASIYILLYLPKVLKRVLIISCISWTKKIIL